MTASARSVVLDRFAWVDGHADVWAVFRDPDAFRIVLDGLVEPFTMVCGIEARGFLLGGAAAVRLNAGFAPIRKAGGLLPGR